MKKYLIVILVLIICALAVWLAAPLFYDKQVQEDFPASLSFEEQPPSSDLVKLPPQEEIDAMTEATRMAVERSIVEKMAKMEPEVMQEEIESMLSGPIRLKEGDFHDADSFHKGEGDALIYQLENGKHLLRLEELNVTNGPDLFVYLSGHPDPETSDELRETYVNLGRLKGNQGNQNYEIPDDVNIEDYQSVVIYCRAFSVLFAIAPLS